ncbi:sensor domain-containing protein, partial [Deinococcus sp. MIMF12]
MMRRMTRTALPPVPPPGRPGLLADLRDAQTYRTALYVGLALPLGALGAGLLLGGVLAGVVTLPLLIGAGLLLGTLWLVPGLADVQRRVARLLGLHLVLQHRAPAGPLPPGGVGGWLRATLADGATYRALMFHLLQLPLAALCWVVVGVLLAASVLGLAAPWWAAGSLPVSWGGGEVTLSAPGVVGLMLAGAGGLLVTGGVLNLLGRVWAWLAFALLSVPQDGASARREVVALRRAAGR